MTYKAIFAALLLTLSIVGCSRQHTAIEGSWTIDIEPMLEQARSMTSSGREINGVRNTFTDGKMDIDNHQIKLSIPGMGGSQNFEYTVLSKDGSCVVVDIKGMPGDHKFCVTGSRLEFHDSTAPLTAVYRKS